MNHLFSYEVGSDGIATLTIDQEHNPVNLYSLEFIEAYINQAEEALKDDQVKGVIITSGQRMFMAGADLREIGGASMGDPARISSSSIMQIHQRMARHRNGRQALCRGYQWHRPRRWDGAVPELSPPNCAE